MRQVDTADIELGEPSLSEYHPPFGDPSGPGVCLIVSAMCLNLHSIAHLQTLVPGVLQTSLDWLGDGAYFSGRSVLWVHHGVALTNRVLVNAL